MNLTLIMNEVTSTAIRTVPRRVERFAHLRLVLNTSKVTLEFSIRSAVALRSQIVKFPIVLPVDIL